jgi:hypothetical protein
VALPVFDAHDRKLVTEYTPSTHYLIISPIRKAPDFSTEAFTTPAFDDIAHRGKSGWTNG